MEKKVYHSINLAKFFFCVCVIGLHTYAFEGLLPEKVYWYVEHLIFRLAVPFFFVASGFFIGSKIYRNPAKSWDYVKYYVWRLSIPLVVFQVINIILESIKLYHIYEMGFIKIALLVIRSILFYPFGALWYLHASIIAILLLYSFIRKGLLNYALLLGIGLYAFALICNSYYFLIEGTALQTIVDLYLYIFASARNGVFVGFLFMGLGIWLSQNFNDGEKRRVSLIGLMISFITLTIEVTYVYGKNFADDGSLFLSFIILIPSLFVFLTTLNSGINETISANARKLSTGMYYLHIPVLSVLTLGSTMTTNSISFFNTFIVVLFTCILICLFSYRYDIKPLAKLLT